MNLKCKKTRIVFLLFSFLIFNQLFNIYIVDIHILRVLNWGYTTCLALYVLNDFISHRIPYTLCKRWNFILIFLGIVLLSFVYVSLTTNQTIDETYRVSISWFQYLLMFFLVKKEFTIKP